MFECRAILVPIEGSSKSFEAAKYAMKLSRRFDDCPLTLCHVISDEILNKLTTHGEKKDVLLKKFSDQAEKYFYKAKRNASIINFDENLINTKILHGDPAKQIAEFSKDNFDLIVLVARGKKHAPEYLVGHVTERIIKLSKVPVFIIP